jgi:hypothetical protein
MEKYIKVYIKSEADLPEPIRDEDGLFTEFAVKNKNGKKDWWIYNPARDKKLWIEYIDWYLLPIPPSAIPTNEEIDEYFSLKIGDTRAVNESLVNRRIGAKWIKSQIQSIHPQSSERENCKWISVDDKLPIDGCEVIGFNEKWIDEDFNPNGTRICGYNDGICWIIVRWNPSQDCWMTDFTDDSDCQSEIPTHWMSIKQRPLINK